MGSFLARTFVSLCLGCEPKARVGTQHFKIHGKNVLLLVTIRIATFCFSSIATIIHIAFCIATHGYLFIPFELHNVKQKFKSTNVIIIDEMLMMTSNML